MPTNLLVVAESSRLGYEGRRTHWAVLAELDGGLENASTNELALQQDKEE
ncbi:MAG TPA: hypothetical protein VI431_13625 [Candidatus Acidoferrum sp.]